MKYYIGIDLGGTNVRVAKVSETGEVIQEVKQASEVHKGIVAVADKMVNMIKSLDNYQECLGVGCAVPGPVDKVKNRSTLATNVPGLNEYDIAEHISKAVGIPVYLDNDVNAAALGEAILGAGKNYGIVYYLTISTGIGGCVVINKKVLGGRNGYAGEIANIIIDRQREKVNYLNVGAVENEASGLSLTRKYNQAFNANETSAKALFDKAKAGDEVALKIVKEAAYDIAQMLSAIAHVIDPHVFIFGGGVMASKDLFFPLVREYFETLVHQDMKNIRFSLPGLKEPGIVGAAMLVQERL